MNTNAQTTNGTSFQLRRTIINLLVMGTIAVTSFSCIDEIVFEPMNPFNHHPRGQGLSWGVKAPAAPTSMTISIDSAKATNDSTLRFWIHVRYDSVMIKSDHGMSYFKFGDTGALAKIFSIKADTIDFRSLPNWTYAYDVEIASDSLKSNTVYNFCPFIDYISGTDTLRLSGESSGRCYSLQTP